MGQICHGLSQIALLWMIPFMTQADCTAVHMNTLQTHQRPLQATHQDSDGNVIGSAQILHQLQSSTAKLPFINKLGLMKNPGSPIPPNSGTYLKIILSVPYHLRYIPGSSHVKASLGLFERTDLLSPSTARVGSLSRRLSVWQSAGMPLWGDLRTYLVQAHKTELLLQDNRKATIILQSCNTLWVETSSTI